MSAPILIGTCGWDHEQWAGGFYPEELPVDWRFCYYSNHLRAVLVPAPTWEVVEVAEVREWIEDCDPQFHFVLELPATLAAPAPLATVKHRLTEFFKLIEPVRAQTTGLMLRVNADGAADPAWLEQAIAALGDVFPLCVDLPPPWRTPEVLACLARHDAGLCWHADAEPAPRCDGRLVVALAATTAPKAQRQVLERLAGCGGEGRSLALFFDSLNGGAQAAKQARLLAEMMGV